LYGKLASGNANEPGPVSVVETVPRKTGCSASDGLSGAVIPENETVSVCPRLDVIHTVFPSLMHVPVSSFQVR